MWNNRCNKNPHFFENQATTSNIYGKRPHPDSNELRSLIKNICYSKTTVDEQIPIILQYISAEAYYYQKVEDICQSLYHHLTYFYRDKIRGIYLFGSAVTNLALKHSDVDIYVDFGEQLPLPPNEFVRTLKNKIAKHRFFVRPMAIPCKVPIVQCLHAPSGIMCDISFLNALGVANSNLVKYLLTLDERIRPIILILKCLMKEEGILGSNAFTSFSLIVLVIFFLQQLEEPLIPAISYLQEKATVREIIAKWDTSFSTARNILPIINNSCSIPELLKLFFTFYAKFEFGLYVISCFTGKAYLKTAFSDLDSLPQEFKCYKENVKKELQYSFESDKFICVQSPFNHARNITRNVKLKTLQQFQKLCYEKMNLCPEEFKKDKNKDYKSVYFVKLFAESTTDFKSLKKTENLEFNIYIGNILKSDNSKSSEKELRNEWAKFVLNNIKDFLRRVMKCNVDAIPQIEDVSECSVNEEIVEILDCELCFFELISRKRNEVRQGFNFPSDLPLLEQEEAITNFLCDIIIKDEDKVSLKFVLTFILEKGPTSICVQFKTKDKVKSNRNFYNQIFQFLKNNFPKYN